MDAATLTALEAALRLTPDNAVLCGVVLRAYVTLGRAAEAGPWLVGRTPEQLSVEDCHAAAVIALATGDTAAAQRVAQRAGAHITLAPGAASSPGAIGDDVVTSGPSPRPAEPAPPEPARGGKARLRVISNDDTTRSDLDRLLEPDDRVITFADVGGLTALKEQIRRKIILPFAKPGLFERFKKRAGGGILMYGPPGCGKTLLARATAGECNARFFNVAISDVLDMYIGESEQKLHALFDKARSSRPAVLFFDEIEALGGKRQFSREGTSAKVVSQFLTEMDGLVAKNDGVLILGATNVPWAVDPAFRRPGRFDRVQFVPPPDRPARADILQMLMEGRPTAGDLKLEALAGRTSGFSGADLKHLVDTAVDLAIDATLASHTEVPVRAEHLDAALREVKPTTLEWLNTAKNYARYSNESGQYDEVLDFLSRHGVSK